MDALFANKKPAIALIKLVEAIGIVLGIPSTFVRSKYKAPIPTNYDQTLYTINKDFYGTLLYLSNLKSSDLTNDVGAMLYAKTIEPGFDYETAVNNGGLAMRDLFNAVMLVIANLEEDLYRLPIKKNNVLCILDGSMSSYNALDTAIHIFNHGILTIAVANVWNDIYATKKYFSMLTNTEFSTDTKNVPNNDILRAHLHEDILRRCKMQYKLTDYSFRVQSVTVDDVFELIDYTNAHVNEYNSDIIVMGINNNNLGLDGNEKLQLWAAWDSKVNALFTKKSSQSIPFAVSHARKTYQICVKNIDDVDYIFSKTLPYLKPGDYVIFANIAEQENAIGDYSYNDLCKSRFALGAKSGWIRATPRAGGAEIDYPPQFPVGWNIQSKHDFHDKMNEFLSKGQIQGRICMVEKSANLSMSESLCKIAMDNEVDIMVIWRRENTETFINCVKTSNCSVLLVK